jgi:hypothetical protein
MFALCIKLSTENRMQKDVERFLFLKYRKNLLTVSVRIKYFELISKIGYDVKE